VPGRPACPFRRAGLLRAGRRADHDDRDDAAIGARQAARARPRTPRSSRWRDGGLTAVKQILLTSMSGTEKFSVTTRPVSIPVPA
jgi:hypothetical protein